MKKLFLFAAFLCVASLTTVNAQCTKSANASKACCAKTSAAISKAVSNDSSIEKKVCATSGKVSYYKNTTCATSGKMTSTEVKYCTKTNAFVNVSPSRSSGSAMPVSAEGKKACTAAEKAACAKSGKKCTKSSKTKSTATKAEAKSQAKFTKGEN